MRPPFLGHCQSSSVQSPSNAECYLCTKKMCLNKKNYKEYDHLYVPILNDYQVTLNGKRKLEKAISKTEYGYLCPTYIYIFTDIHILIAELIYMKYL